MILVEGVCRHQRKALSACRLVASRPKFVVSADGTGVVGQAGARLLPDLADAAGQTTAYSAALRSIRPRGIELISLRQAFPVQTEELGAS
jgi:hypothetical protein